MNKQRVFTWLAALALFLLPCALAADDLAVIVGFHGQPDRGIFARFGGRSRGDLQALRASTGRVPAAALAALRASPGVAYVEEDLVRQATVTPNDTYYASYQADDFGLINCPAAWDISKGTGVRVAVLDTGCQLSHPDIGSGTSGKVKVWRNFTGKRPTDVNDINGHGTHTAGTVGARTNNARGVAAAGFDCHLAVGKVLGNSGVGYDSWVANGITWSVDTAGAKVISMSLGATGASTTLENAVDYAWGKGAVLVGAAGNDSNDTLNYPAAFTNCIAVAATDNAGTLASFSNFGVWVDIAGPGVEIASTYKGSNYALASGTSMATPHVSGVAALVWATPHGTSNVSVRTRLEGTATGNVATPAGDVKLLDAAAAVAP